ncbi:MAG: hypothetical protein GY812_17595 [Actinomycetia bacterium]|nr:hypothetical protein [Actinomycetes bacterium]
MATAVAPPEPTSPEPEPLPGDPRRPLLAERAISLLLAGFVALFASGPITDNSLLTHIATGRLQVDSGLPSENPFLTTSTDFPVPSWWWSWALGTAENLAGSLGIRILTVAVAALLGLLVVRAARPLDRADRPSPTLLGQALPAAVVLAMLVPFVNGRPQLPGFVLLAATLVVWRERRSPWWLVAVFAIWVNVHGSWLYGAGVLGLSWLAEAIDARHIDWARLRWFAGAAGGLLLGGIWYPERFRLVLLPTEQLGSEEAREAMRLYVEWQPVSAGSSYFWVLCLIVLLAAYGAWRQRLAGMAVLTVMLAFLGFGATRMLPIAAITLAGAAAVGVVATSAIAPPGHRARQVMSAVGIAALVGAVVLAATGPHEDLERYPSEEVAWLEARGLVANPDVTVLHNDWVGNYLEYLYGADANAWIDDRPAVETLLDYSSMRRLNDDWQEAFARADPDVVLWYSELPLGDELDARSDWETVLTTDDYQLLCHARIASRCL